MEIRAIKTEADYKYTLKIIDRLLCCTEDSKEAELLEILSILVENYENKHYAIELPDPIAAINYRVEQLGLTRQDLEESIGSRGRVSEVLNKKRSLTLKMIRNLQRNLNIPAQVLINEYSRKTA